MADNSDDWWIMRLLPVLWGLRDSVKILLLVLLMAAASVVLWWPRLAKVVSSSPTAAGPAVPPAEANAPAPAAPVPPAMAGGRGGDAKVGGNGIAIGGPGGNIGPGGVGRGGDGGGGEVHGDGIAAGGAGGSVDGVNIWYPPAVSGYETYMRQTGQQPDPALKPFGRGSMSAGYAPKFVLIEQLRAEYFKARGQPPRSVDEDIGAVPLEYLNQRLQDMGERWRARITATEQYEFFVP
jgi:hypothetical protein